MRAKLRFYATVSISYVLLDNPSAHSYISDPLSDGPSVTLATKTV